MTLSSRPEGSLPDGHHLKVVDPPGKGPIVAIAAHPDDIESWCAGTLARAMDAGAEVRVLLVTSGDKGSSDPDADPRQVAAMREREAAEAARRLGIAEVVFLRELDGEIEDTRALRGEIVAWIRRWKPFAVFTHDPEHPYPPYITHRDHRVVGRVVLDAVYPLARDPLNFPEHREQGLGAHIVNEVWLFSSTAADSYVDISDGFARKIDARLAHESQTSDPDALAEGWAARAREIGAPAGLACAEAFTVVRLG